MYSSWADFSASPRFFRSVAMRFTSSSESSPLPRILIFGKPAPLKSPQDSPGRSFFPEMISRTWSSV